MVGVFDNSSSLFSLIHLQKLNLAVNNFTSRIASGFSKLDRLTYLNLSSHAISAWDIPIDISQLTRLVTLDLSYPLCLSLFQSVKFEIPNMQTFLQNLTSLRQLYLDDISLSTKVQEWGNALLPLRHLEELSMSYCVLSGPLHSSLTKLVNLSVIILDGNNLSSSIPETFANFKKLTTLRLSNCGLIGTFPQKIFQIGTLSHIDLSFNYNLHGSFPDYSTSESLYTINLKDTQFSGTIPYTIGNLRNLIELDLSYCQFNGTLPHSLSNLTHLTSLYLFDNNLSGQIPHSLSNLTHLTFLDLSDNNLSGQIPHSLSNLTHLTSLALSTNNLSGQIPHSLSNLTHLTFLYLYDNNLSGQIPHSLSNLTHLTSLDLSANSLSGQIPHSLSNLTHLTSLHLSDNNLSGQIPHSLSNLTHLISLDLFHNNLSGQIPLSLFTLQSLEMIDLSSNRLNGSLQLDDVLKLRSLTILALSHNNISIDVNVANVDLSLVPKFTNLRLASCNLKLFPNFLINQSSLTYLDLSNNQIQGEIPYWISRLHDLQSLTLSHNKLHGSIPVFPKQAYFHDYSYNNFSVVPQDVGNNLSSLNFLSFSNNNLHGHIPNYLCNASHLEFLDISFNNFSGTIPPCLITVNLKALNMRNNILTGPIPDIFLDSYYLRKLNFHGNLLHGPIPKSLSNCSSLEILDIGSNQIVDSFPCFLNSISTLRVLVLRNNKFHGSIECLHFVENAAWKMIQIMDIAFNNFNGKLPDKYFTTWERMMNDEDDNVNFNQVGMFYVNAYYHDSVTVTCKGQQQEWVNILTIYKAIDFSSNFFKGPIPESLMDLKELYILNFSNNGLTGKIPSSIGNLKQLESLDFSNNSLVGEIPVQLASITFLSYLNLSFNHLVGKIPTGTQLQSFRASSFEGNDGLYGPPLNEILPDGKMKDLHPQPACESLVCSTDLNFLSVELGFVFGLGMIIGPVMFWKKWRVGYWRLADRILCKIFPWMHIEYATERGKTYTVLRW